MLRTLHGMMYSGMQIEIGWPRRNAFLVAICRSRVLSVQHCRENHVPWQVVPVVAHVDTWVMGFPRSV